LEDFSRMLPYTLVSLKVLAIQIVLAQSARPVISPAISHKDPANKPASEVLSSWSPLASLFCDYINSVGHLPLFLLLTLSRDY
jgi:hypothetical protein